MSYGWNFYVDRKPWRGSRSFDLRITRYLGLGRGTKQAVTGFNLVEVPECGEVPIVASHSEEEAQDSHISFLQAAMDAAWEVGLRPMAYEDTRQELAAIKYHLEDMRLLAKVRDKNGGAS